MRSLTVAIVLAFPTAVAAQAAPPPAAPAPAPAPAIAVAAPALNPQRASWLSDHRPLRVGDILTIVVDEQTAAREQVTTDAAANRAMHPKLNIGVDVGSKLGPAKELSTGIESSSHDQSNAQRSGNLTAVIAVKVAALDALGNARIEGAKVVTVDGRNQEVKLAGTVRPEDVSPDYLVSSSRIADATISYKGKKIGPRMGILGKILSILWP
jgi:flagellar L-ring protein precursor FlgH